MTGNRSRLWLSLVAVVALLAAGPAPARAETQHIPMGLSDFMGGVLPPPGYYWLNYLVYVQKNSLLDDNGDEKIATPVGTAKTDLDAKVFVDAFRFVWMTPAKIAGATYGAQVIFPVYTASAKLDVGGAQAFDSDSTGLGDITVNPLILAWHFSPNFHAGFGLDIVLPTGPYDKKEPATQVLNKNHWTFEPLVAVSYWVPGGFDASAKIMYDIHTKNSDFLPPGATASVDLKPGQEFHVDWGLSYALGKEDLRAGLAGFYYMQTTADEVAGVEQDKGRQAAIGPALKWWPGMKKFSLTAKYLKEFAGKNVKEGQSFWLNTVYAF